MRLGISIDYSSDFRTIAREVVDYESAGAELVSVAEAYSFDAVSRLGYLAAVTSSVTLASGILPIYSRTPTLLAMTAAGLDSLTGGRFELGLGASGPQVIEGFHGVPFSAPLGRTREIIDICRAVWRREKIDHDGTYYQIPLPADRGSGLGKPLKLINTPVRPHIPITVAALTPASVAQAAEIADGWAPIFFHPEKAVEAWGDALATGLALRSDELGPLAVETSVPMLVGESGDAAVEQATRAHRDQLALYIGGMGARGKNFYNDLAVRYGYVDEAAEIQELYLTGQKEAAAALVPDDLVAAVSLIGTEQHIAERLSAFAAAGTTTLSLQLLAQTPGARVEGVELVRTLLDAASASGSPASTPLA